MNTVQLERADVGSRKTRRRSSSKDAKPEPQEASKTVASLEAPDAATWDVQGFARIVDLEEGLYALTVGPADASGKSAKGVALPTSTVMPGPAKERSLVEIVFTSAKEPGWLSAQGGTVIAKAPSGGGTVVVTSYGLAEPSQLPQLHMLRLDGPDALAQSTPVPAAAQSSAQAVPIEMTTHIEREGDRRVLAHGWIGSPGQRKRIEAFGIRPLEAIAPGDIEYMAFGPGNRSTPWVTDAKLCGTRGRGLPLTGFAIRLAPALRERFSVVYEGSFFDFGAVGPIRDGEPCVSLVANDPLEAIKVQIIERKDK